MTIRMQRALTLGALVAFVAMGGCRGGSSSENSAGNAPTPAPAPVIMAPAVSFVDAQRAQCVATSEYLSVAHPERPDVSGTVEMPVTASEPSQGACRDNTEFQYGSGLYDITGPIANTGGMGWENPAQVLSGLHQRQYARAFVIASPCNNKRVVFVSTDTGMVFGSVRQGVLAKIAADAALKELYGADNVMLSATHTHSGPAGYSHHEAFNLFHFGFDQQVLDTIVDGIYKAILLAHQNLEANPESGRIGLAVGELLNTNINRSKPAFLQNPESERMEFRESTGELPQPVEVDKRVVQLNLVRNNGSAVGVINWFGVHPTVIGPNQDLVSSDNKGYASLGFERIMSTDYTREPDSDTGDDSFVAAFAQADEGDASPNIRIEEYPHPSPYRGGGKDHYESNAISGTKQLAKALELAGVQRALSGPVDYRFFHVQMNNVQVEDYAGPPLSEALDSADKRTCTAALGVSFGAGAEDGPGPSAEGARCDDPDFAQQAADDFAAFTAGKIPPNLAATTVLCNISALPPELTGAAGMDLSCHAEKPILFALGAPVSAEPEILPFQLFRLGNVAVLGIPWEVTTMAARRLRKTLYEVLAPVGVDTVVIAGLVNDYVHYLTTREEYSVQHYEGASNLFGPWTLAAVRQESRKLAVSIAAGTALPSAGPGYVDGMPINPGSAILTRPPYVASDSTSRADYGDAIDEPQPQAIPGDTVTATFQAAHPRNDLLTQSSYVFVERKVGAEWQVVARDRDPELVYRWAAEMPSPLPIDPVPIGPSTGIAQWTIPLNTPAGTYRFAWRGAAQELLATEATAYEGFSTSFEVTVVGPGLNCADRLSEEARTLNRGETPAAPAQSGPLPFALP